MSNKVNLNQNSISFLNNSNSQLCILTGTQDQIDISGSGADSNFTLDLSTTSTNVSGIFLGTDFSFTTNNTLPEMTVSNNLNINGTNFDYDSPGLITIIITNILDLTSQTDQIRFNTGNYILLNSPSTVIENGGSGSPESSSILTLNSTTQGFTTTNLTRTQRNNISSPPDGLTVYDTNTNGLFVRVNKTSPTLNTWLGIRARQYYIYAELTSQINVGIGPVNTELGNNITVVGNGISYNTTTSAFSFNLSTNAYFTFYSNLYLTNIGGQQGGRLNLGLYKDGNSSSFIERLTFLIIEGASSGQLNEENFAVIGRTMEQGVDFVSTINILLISDRAYSYDLDTFATWFCFTEI